MSTKIIYFKRQICRGEYPNVGENEEHFTSSESSTSSLKEISISNSKSKSLLLTSAETTEVGSLMSEKLYSSTRHRYAVMLETVPKPTSCRKHNNAKLFRTVCKIEKKKINKRSLWTKK
jgi:hypothetical protein